MNLKRLILVSTALMVTVASFGQKLHLSGSLQNMHLWRGLQVADGGVLSADMGLGLIDDKLRIGLWGGTDFTGDYKEFDYYISYSVSGFSVAVWDIFNYSPELPFSKDIFNYNKYSTGHFLDLGLSYDFDHAFEVPLRLKWTTVFAGRDNINQISIRTTYRLKLGRYKMPIFAHAMWNPDARKEYLQVGVDLFAF